MAIAAQFVLLLQSVLSLKLHSIFGFEVSMWRPVTMELSGF
jgi:hypothetical protein